MAKGRRIKGTNQFFDSGFSFLLEIDPVFEEWRALAAEWWPTQKNNNNKQAALSAFFVRYLHAQHMDKRPVALFEAGTRLPDLSATMDLASLSGRDGIKGHDTISDFLDWVLRTHLAEPDAEGHRV